MKRADFEPALHSLTYYGFLAWIPRFARNDRALHREKLRV